MRWSSSMISKLARVRDIRMRLAEMELSRTDHDLADCRQVEEQARNALAATTERSVAETAQANKALLARTAGGRRGISEWQAAHKRAKSATQKASGNLDDAVSNRVGKEMEFWTARSRWRDARFEVERLRLLTEHLTENAE